MRPTGRGVGSYFSVTLELIHCRHLFRKKKRVVHGKSIYFLNCRNDALKLKNQSCLLLYVGN